MDMRALLDPKTSTYDAYEYLSGYGVTDASKALANLRLIAGGVEDPLLAAILTALLKACSLSADPDTCLNNFERVSDSFGPREAFLAAISRRPECITLLAPLFASSMFLTRFIIGNPAELIGWLLDEGRLDGPKERDALARECMEHCPPDTPADEAMGRLRYFKYREFLRITVRDLLGRADIAEATRELSNLADAALDAALGVAIRELDGRYGQPRYKTPGGRHARCPFAVIGLGKLGGQELNFSSDIDIMYAYLTDEGETSGPQVVTNHQYFVKLGERITKLMGEKTADGLVFRVDLRLRPDGERGDLAQCLAGLETYYESWGQTWERSAMIKARPCAGDMGFGREFLGMIRPFVFRKYLDYSSIGEIREMKQRIEKAGAAKAGREIDLKLGVGGIREIEFFISALQLIYGGRAPGVRERNTMKALHRLALKDLISFEEQRDLTRAYEFLRTAEHRLQLVDERQTHSLPDDSASVQALARRMGFRDGPETGAGEAFMREYRRHTSRVRDIYDGLFSEKGREDSGREEGFEALMAEDVSEEDASGILSGAGFGQPHRAFRNVLLLRDGSTGSALTPRSRRLFMGIMPLLLRGCADSPDPDMALNNLESFVSSFGSREAIYTLISGKPEAAMLITRLLGSSEYFSRLLVAHPEMSDLLLLSGEEGLDKDEAVIASELGAFLGEGGVFAEKMDLLRRYKHTEEIRAGIRDILQNPGYRAISHDLTTLAEAVLGASLDMSYDDIAGRYGVPRGLEKGRGVAVVGMGKLGGRALNYGSDLDIVFVCAETKSPATKTSIGMKEFFDRLAERVIFALSSLTREGVAFRVDTRLRPGGSKGVLAHTIAGLEAYYGKSASTWELQALTKARAVAGDKGLSEGFERLRTAVLTRPRDPGKLTSDVKAMRARMERELGRKTKGGHDIKYGRGGIVDVEFMVQYLQLLHGPGHPGLLTPDTTEALAMLSGQDILSKEETDGLMKSYGFLRELESKIRITTGQGGSVLPDEAAKLTVLAARMGYASKGAEAARSLMDDYTRCTERVRAAFERVVRY